MTEFAEESPSDRSGTALADWVEAMMLVEGTKRMSRTGLRRRLKGGDAADVDIDLLVSEIERRRRLAPAIYPFERTTRGVARVSDVSPAIYSLLLWLSVPF